MKWKYNYILLTDMPNYCGGGGHFHTKRGMDERTGRVSFFSIIGPFEGIYFWPIIMVHQKVFISEIVS